MAVVYIATNLVNGKRYVGATICTLTKRKREHKCAAKRRNLREKNMLFYKAVRKYGFNNFSFSVLLECEPEKVFSEEVRFIALMQPEYNGTRGGEGCIGRKMSEYCRHQLAEGRKKHAKRIKKTASELGKTAEARARFDRYRHLGPKSFARLVMCVDDGRIYESASAAARYYAVSKSAVIELCLGKNGRKTVGGRQFIYYVGPMKEAI